MHVNFLLFPALTQLDLTGPYEVLARAPGFTIDFVSSSMDPVQSDRGLTLLPTATFDSARSCDLLVVPGGPGTDTVMLDPDWVAFTARQGAQARFILGICTGSLLLGAAGLLRAKRAACHWQAREFLPAFGAIADASRMCVDGTLFTSGGVTSGIDMALKAVGLMLDEDTARQIQLQIEYDPEPPFPGGTPHTSPARIVERCLAASRERHAIRAEAVSQAARALEAATAG
ncbi:MULTISPECIES: DJ-1/PfpI family protein [unclassified Pseudomonas]|uniref:DJ-1/PfpI family protein n=1 Tax=unclassified Pseudomonas TaxID=196821 RepID=UPI0035C1D52C